MDPLVEIDRNVRKLEIFLANSNPPLTVADLRRYLPCTVNVDPYLRKLIRGLNHSISVVDADQFLLIYYTINILLAFYFILLYYLLYLNVSVQPNPGSPGR